MANTTNYNWETPDDTDLVKDGAAAIRTLGNSIDTTTKNLNPETTTGDIAYRSATANTNTRLSIGSAGQVLTVAAGVPSWATPTTGDIEGVTAGTGISGGGTSGTVTITNSMATAIDAKGDLVAGTGADAFARLGVGANGTLLTADSSEATGLKWAAPAASTPTAVGASAYKSGNQSIGNATFTAVTFNTEFFDTDAFHDNSTNTSRFTIPSGKGGKYLVTTMITFAQNANGRRLLRIRLNNTTTYAECEAPASGVGDTSITLQSTILLNLVATDYIEAFAYQASGGSLDIFGGESGCNLGITYLGA